MACVVMAYVVMAHAVMACVVMAYVGMVPCCFWTRDTSYHSSVGGACAWGDLLELFDGPIF